MEKQLTLHGVGSRKGYDPTFNIGGKDRFSVSARSWSVRGSKEVEAEMMQGEEADLAGRILAFVEENFRSKELYTETVAEHFGISEGYLCRLVKERTGKTLVDFLHERRVEEAKKLLQESKDYMYQIADQVGFKDLSYFSRVFKELTGECPTAYRRRYVESQRWLG